MKLSERAIAAIVQELRLTSRATEYVQCALEGKSMGETAIELVVTEKTAKNVLKNVYRKAGVANRTQLIALIIRKMDELARSRA